MKDVDAVDSKKSLTCYFYCTRAHGIRLVKKYRLVYVTAAALLNQIEDTLPCLSIF